MSRQIRIEPPPEFRRFLDGRPHYDWEGVQRILPALLGYLMTIGGFLANLPDGRSDIFWARVGGLWLRFRYDPEAHAILVHYGKRQLGRFDDSTTLPELAAFFEDAEIGNLVAA
jgi:hypothetical protein